MNPLINHTQAKHRSTRSLLLGIWGHLTRRRRVQLLLLLLLMLASGAAELLSLGAVLPFLAVLSAPEQLWGQPTFHMLVTKFGFTAPEQLLLPATIFFALAVMSSAAVRLANLSSSLRLAAAIGSDLSVEVYRRTLYQPYEVHLHLNSSAVISTITNQVARTVEAFKAALLFATSIFVSTSLFIGLLLIDWKLALAAAVLFLNVYFLIAQVSTRRLSRNSDQIRAASGELVKAVQEGLGAIREVILYGSQALYLDIYLKADRCQRQLSAKNDFLVYFPRYVLETLGMLSLALIGYLLVEQTVNGNSLIPLLGGLALGAQRILPALQQAYGGWALLKGFNADLEGVIEVLDQQHQSGITAVAPFEFNQSIQFQNVRFRYAKQMPEVLKGLDFEIRRGERIGLIGSTGSGKSTTVDLLMGLLVPRGGQLLVNGLDLHDPKHPERLIAWRASISHVPQNIYFADSSIAENIAFGIPKEQINMDRVRHAAAQAQIASFIEDSVDGYKSYIGERGIRLSGGQRQRIGIARALYKQTRILVFDEATSALDVETEMDLMDAIDGLDSELTILLVAHRLDTLKRCDSIIKLENGRVVS